jgi:hypothetical protein
MLAKLQYASDFVLFAIRFSSKFDEIATWWQKMAADLSRLSQGNS